MKPSAVLTGGQSGQRLRIGNDRARLMEGADEVLTARMIHTGFAAHGRIHLGKQRSRHLNEVDAALITRCCESDDIADDPSAERHQCSVTIEAAVDQCIEDVCRGGERLVLFTIRQHADSHTFAGSGERITDCAGIQRLNGGVGDD